MFYFIFLRVRERQSINRGGAEMGTQNPKQAPEEPDVGLKPTNVRSWPEPNSDAQPTEPPRQPNIENFKIMPCVLI